MKKIKPKHCRECMYHIDPQFKNCPEFVVSDYCGHPEVDRHILKPYAAKNCPYFAPMDAKNMTKSIKGEFTPLPTWLSV